MDCIVHGVTKSETRLSEFHFISLHFGEVSLVSFSISEKECQDNGNGEQTRPRVGGLCVLLAAESLKLSRCLKVLLDKVMNGKGWANKSRSNHRIRFACFRAWEPLVAQWSPKPHILVLLHLFIY